MLHRLFLQERMVGTAVCPRVNCPSNEHDVWFEYNGKHEVIATMFKCRICDAEDWGGDEHRKTNE